MQAVAMAASEDLGWDDSRVVRAKAHPHVEVVAERDARAMNHMEPGTRLIHARLEEWARAVKPWCGAQGYPDESYYHKWALLKIAPQPGQECDLSDRVAHVDAAVARLGEPDKAVLKRFYLRWRPLDIWKHLPGINSETTFKRTLKRARWRVEGYLMAIEEK
jgi:hypothetical protein